MNRSSPATSRSIRRRPKSRRRFAGHGETWFRSRASIARGGSDRIGRRTVDARDGKGIRSRRRVGKGAPGDEAQAVAAANTFGGAAGRHGIMPPLDRSSCLSSRIRHWPTWSAVVAAIRFSIGELFRLVLWRFRPARRRSRQHRGRRRRAKASHPAGRAQGRSHKLQRLPRCGPPYSSVSAIARSLRWGRP